MSSGSVWTTWNDARHPAEISTRPDCLARTTDEVCCAFAGHPGGHTYEVTDPWHLESR